MLYQGKAETMQKLKQDNMLELSSIEQLNFRLRF